MHRFYIPPSQCSGPNLVLAGSEGHHAVHVLRLRQGDKVTVLDGAGTVLECEIAACERSAAELRVVERKTFPPPACSITLIQALPKGKTMDAIIQKATELGVSRIVPLLAERVVVKLDTEDTAAKQAKWQKVAEEAIKQCGLAWLPQVATPMSVNELLRRQDKFDLAFAGSLRNNARHPRSCFRAFEASNGRRPESLAVWVGPEGDFTSAELDAIEAGGALPISLGPLVLRVETAAVYCLSILDYELRSPAD